MNAYAILKGREVVPVSFEEWGPWFEGSVNHPGSAHHPRFIARANFGDVQVSTVFLGINHGWVGRDKWFETMIFGGEHDDFQERYETFDEALEGFLKAVIMCRASLARNCK